MTTAYLFDLDGTLVDSLADIVAACRETAKQFNASAEYVSYPLVQSFIGRGIDNLAEKFWHSLKGLILQQDFPTLEVFKAELLQHYKVYNGNFSKPYPGVKDGLLALKNCSAPLACVTNKPHQLAEQLLQRHGLRDFFEVVIGGCAEVAKKPAPDMLHLALKQLKQTQQQAVMVGDSTNDTFAAQRANCEAVLVSYGYGYEFARQHGGYQHCIDSLTCLKQLYEA